MSFQSDLARDTYQTDKITFAAYLIATGKSELVKVLSNGTDKRVTFVLAPTPTVSDIAAFFDGNAQVPAINYSEAINELKRQAYRVKGGNHHAI
jgi:hypothetical protein